MGKTRNRIIDLAASVLYAAFRKCFISEKFTSLYISDYEKELPVAEAIKDGTTFRFHTPNPVTRWRVETLFEKEPETIEWIDSFDEGDVLYDAGANVGMYTIYAAAAGKAARVIAFEPESASYALLNRNIALNGLDGKVTALNAALSDTGKLDRLYLSGLGAGGAIHNFGEDVDLNKKKFSSAFRQGCLAFSLDEFIKRYAPPFPNHLKIDVDGLEKEIVEGAAETLADPRLKTLLVEINEGLKEDLELAEDIKKRGFRLRCRKHAAMFDGGPYGKIYNYVFEK